MSVLASDAALWIVPEATKLTAGRGAHGRSEREPKYLLTSENNISVGIL